MSAVEIHAGAAPDPMPDWHSIDWRNVWRKWIKKKYFRQDGHRHWVFTGLLLDQKGKGWPIQLMAAAIGEDHSLCEDP